MSKKLLEKKKFLAIHKELFKFMTKISRAGNSHSLFNELFTKTEKLMIAKRLAIIYLISQKESLYAIEQTLKVSPSTVARMSYKYEKGNYKELVKEIREQSSFWAQLERIVPPKVGRNRFKNFLQF